MNREEWYQNYRRVRTVMRGANGSLMENEKMKNNVFDVVFGVLYDWVLKNYPLESGVHFGKNSAFRCWRKPDERYKIKMNLVLPPDACEAHRLRCRRLENESNTNAVR